MTKVKDIWTPRKPTREKFRTLFKHLTPNLEMKIGEHGVEVEVEFFFL